MTAVTTAVTRSAGQQYLADVERELADLPAEERSALLEDLASHLAALDQEDGDDRPLEVRLGRPRDYAAELRAAADLPPQGAAAARRAPALRPLADRLLAETRAFLPQVLPGWWVLRAYLALVLLLSALDASPRTAVLLQVGPALLGGLVLLAVAVVASVALGRARLPRPLALGVHTAEVLLLLAVLSFLDGATSRTYVDTSTSSPYATEAYPLLSTAGPVTDVLPYAADGTPLEGVLLFDQDGRPLRTGEQEWWADGCTRRLEPPRAADGVPVTFSFPQVYALDPLQPQDGCTAAVTRPDVPLPQFAPTAVPAPVAPAS